MNPFWIGGGVLFVWALILAFALGMRNEGFPRDDGQLRGVIVVSLVLTAIAVTTAIVSGISGAGADKGLRHGPSTGAEKHSE